jgi:hypothetical protein
MTHFVHQYATLLAAPTGTYVARVYGHQQETGLWEAWFVFFPLAGGEPLATDRETTQSKREDVVYWATGISATYLEGALQRALDRRPEVQLARRIASAERDAAQRRAELEVYRLAADQALEAARAAEAERRDAERTLEERVLGEPHRGLPAL